MVNALSDEEEDTPANDLPTFLSPESPQQDTLTNEMVDLLDEADSAAQNVPNSDNLCDVKTSPREKTLGTTTLDRFSTPNFLEIRKKVKAKKISNFAKRTSNDQKSGLKHEGVKERFPKSDEVQPARGMLRVSSFARMSENNEMTAVRSTYPDNYDIIGMGVVNSAEDQFFRDQMDPEKQRESHFYWGMISNLPPPPPPPPVVQMSDVLLLPTSEEQYEAFLTACASGVPRYKERSRSKVSARKRRSSDSEARLVGSHVKKGQNPNRHIKDTQSNIFLSAKKSKDAETNAKLIQKTTDNDDYIKELRTKLLSSVKKNEEKSQISQRETEVPVSIQTKPEPSLSKSKLLLSMTKSPKRPNSALGSLSKKTLRAKAISSLRDEETRKKHFPNLFCTTIISFSDSEDDDSVDQSNNQSKSDPLVLSNDFEAHLNSFLKSIRTSEENKAIPPPKPARKNPPGKLTNLKTMISNVQKVKSFKSVDQPNSMLMLMPPEKQEEYKRLKALIEKKEKAKRLSLTSKVVSAAKLPAKPIESKDSQEKLRDDDEDENDLEAQLLREKLLSSMMKKKSGDNGESKQKQSLTVSISQSQKTRKVSLGSKQKVSKPLNSKVPPEILPQTAGKAHEVQNTNSKDPKFKAINEKSHLHIPKCSSPVPSSASCAIRSPQSTVDDVQALKDSEKMLYLSRIAMIQRLGKLSEGTHLMVDERNKVQDAEKFAEDLRKQLAQVEEIIESRNQRFNQLQISAKETHKALIPLRHRIVEAESLCLSNGFIVHGSTYKVPIRGTEKIEELWSEVRQNVGTLMFHKREATPNGEKVDEQVKPVSVLDKILGVTSDQVVIEPLSSSSQTMNLEEVNPSSQENVPDFDNVNQVGFHCLNNSSYEWSALEHLKPQNGLKLNPFQDLCPFWLMGRCNNETCQYQHS